MFLPSEFGTNTGLHYFLTIASTGAEITLSEPRDPETRRHWDAVTSEVRQRAASWERRTTDAALRLGDVEDVLLSSVRRLRSQFPEAADAPVLQRIHQLAAMLGCGVVLMANPEQIGAA